MNRWDALTPLLVHIHAHFEEDLRLEVLADRVALSPFQLHRQFKALTGETPKAYITRLRLERSVFRMLIDDATLLTIALDCGFPNQETYIRAFRRRYGMAPGEFRRTLQAPGGDQPAQAVHDDRDALPDYALSPTRLAQLKPLHLACLRHTGPYEDVPQSLFTRLAKWAAQHPPPGPPMWLGIGHDAPGITPPAQCRFDAGLLVPAPIERDGDVFPQLLPGGDVIMTRHVGPYSTLPRAYGEIFARAQAAKDYMLIGLPAIELYQTTYIDVNRALCHTDICLPVVRLVQK